VIQIVIGQKYNNILVIVDKFIKWGYFILYSKGITLEELSRIYIKEVFIRYRVLTKIILDRDRKFILEF
jgi:hypothetical protein